MRLPLEHVKIIDLTQVWAGPFSTQMLAAMGAEVIHVESQHRPDLARTFDIQDVPTHIPEDRSPYFNQHNRKKKAISLDLSSEKGREIFLRMIPNVDCVINNFSRRVLPNWGFTYERLSAINPGIIMLGMPSHGATGPQADYVCFGEALEGATGLVAPRGYVQGEPLRSGAAYPDPAGGLVAASALLAGLAYRRRTGKGMNFDMSQRDCSIRLMGEAFLGYGMNGEEPSQLNNAHPHWAPHRAYRAAGDDQWLTIACANDEQWRALATAIVNTLKWIHSHSPEEIMARMPPELVARMATDIAAAGRSLARGWLCEAPGEQRPCGACPSCHLFDNRSHPDLRLLLPETLRAFSGFRLVVNGLILVLIVLFLPRGIWDAERVRGWFGREGRRT